LNGVLEIKLKHGPKCGGGSKIVATVRQLRCGESSPLGVASASASCAHRLEDRPLSPCRIEWLLSGLTANSQCRPGTGAGDRPVQSAESASRGWCEATSAKLSRCRRQVSTWAVSTAC
jgi:hypothetical protein